MVFRQAPVELPGLAPMPGQPFGVYLHVPFCLTRCGYCDFNTYTPAQLGGVSPDRWLLALRAELELAAAKLDAPTVHTVYVGGGTPSLLGGAPGHVAGHGAGPLCAGARRRSQHRGQPRVDVAGVLRHDPRGRLHAGVARHAVGGPEGAGNLGPGALAGPGGGRGHRGDSGGLHTRQPRPDLWNPGESDDDLVRSVDAAVQAGVDHVSAYALVVEHGTALARRVRRGELAAPDDDVLAHRYELVDARLSAAGFAWYEVSNWCRPGGECRHNLGYWDGGQWWGAGPGAHGYIGVTRWWNVKHPNTYAEILAGATLPVAGFEQLGADALHTEDVLLKVRLRQGLPLARLGAAEQERAEAVLADGLLDYHGDRLVLTGRGRLLADAVVRTLLG